jgi:hypothetical protein
MAALMSNPQTLNQTVNQSQPTNNNNTIPYWGYFGSMQGGGSYMDYDPTNTQYGQDFLNAVHKYDPNARFVSQTLNDGGAGQASYYLDMDRSKIPGLNGKVDMNQGDFNPMYYGDPRSHAGYGQGEMNAYAQAHPRSFDTNALYRPDYIKQDSILGNWTPQANVRPDQGDWISKFGPMLPMLFATILSGGTLSPMMGAFLKAPQILGSALSGEGFDPLQLASLGAPFIPGAGSVMPYLNAGRMIFNMTGGGR